MKGFLCILALLVAGFVAFGFYQKWFTLSTTTPDHNTNVDLKVDREKIHQDEEKVKGKIEDFRHKDKTPEAAEKGKKEDPKP